MTAKYWQVENGLMYVPPKNLFNTRFIILYENNTYLLEKLDCNFFYS